MEFTVKRSEWLRGKGSDESYLLREDGFKCCVGFFCLAAGLSPKQIEDDKEIEKKHDDMRHDLFMDFYNITRTSWAADVYCTNDDTRIRDAEREERLTRMFLNRGHIIKFVD